MARNIAYQPGYGTFNGTNFLSVASNATLQTGPVDWWVYTEVNLATKSTSGIVTRWTVAGAAEFALWYDSGIDRFKLSVSKNGTDVSQTVVIANTFGAPTIGAWVSLFARLDSTGAGTAGLSVNAGAEDTGSMSSTIGAAQTVQTRIGAFSGTDYPVTATVRNVIFGKDLPGGFATTPPATIRNGIYTGGINGTGLRPDQITAAQRTAWGVVSGWLGTSLLGDDIGSNTLTNNNTVTFTAPSARSIASNRRLINTATLTGASTVDATGLFVAISVDENATAGWYGPPTATSGGVPVTLGTPVVGSPSGGYRTWSYPVTNGNPSGNPILAGSTVVMSYGWGTWVKNGVGNTAGSVMATNSSTAVSSILTDLMGYWTLDSVLTDSSGNGNTLTNGNAFTFVPGKVGNGANFDRVSSQYAAAASNASLQTGNIDFTGWFWINIGALSISAGGSLVLMQKGASGSGGAGNYEYSVLYSGTGVDRFRIFMSSGGSEGGGNDAVFGPVTANIWNFVVFWYDSVNNLIGLQINNGTATTFSWAPGPQTVAGPLNIAGQGAVQNIQGIMDEIGFRKRLLTDAEKAALFNYGNGRTYPFNW